MDTYVCIPYIRWLTVSVQYLQQRRYGNIHTIHETTVYVQGQLYTTTIAKTVCKAMKIWMHMMYVPCIRQLFSAYTHVAKTVPIPYTDAQKVVFYRYVFSP